VQRSKSLLTFVVQLASPFARPPSRPKAISHGLVAEGLAEIKDALESRRWFRVLEEASCAT